MTTFKDMHGQVLQPGDYVRNDTAQPFLKNIQRVGQVIDSEKEGVFPYNRSHYLTVRWETSWWFKNGRDWVADSYKQVYTEDQSPRMEKLSEEEYILYVLSEI
jgi:hypothetical protein